MTPQQALDLAHDRPECSDEAEKLRGLLHAIDRAQDPHRHKGALL